MLKNAERWLSMLLAEDYIYEFPSSLKTNLLKVLLCFYDSGVIKGSFARTKMSLSDFFFLSVRYNGWLFKDMC